MVPKENIIFQPLPANYHNLALQLIVDVFSAEQNIPAELVPLDEQCEPSWWCASKGENIIGVVAIWKDKDELHWGRFAVHEDYRGLGIGKRLLFTH